MKTKKIIAAVLSAVMLCLTLPFAALSVSAAGEFDIIYANTYDCDNSNPTTYYDSSGVAGFTALSGRAGYTFIRWSPTSIGAGETGAKTITAIWKNNNPSATPTYDYETEEITGLVPEAEYQISSTTGHFATAGGTLSITSYIGTEITLTHKGNGTTDLDSDPVTFIVPGRPAAPSLTTENESSNGGNNGKIKGLTAVTNYEYKIAGGNYSPISGVTEIANLAPGTYSVRLAANTSPGQEAFASPATELTINAYIQNTDANLSALSISPFTLNESFDPERTAYTATVPYETTEITITATPNDPNATVDGNTGSEPFTSNELLYSVIVTAQSGAEKTYTITVTRSAATGGLNLLSDGNIQYGNIIIPQDTASPILGGGSYSFADGVLTLTNVNFTTSSMLVLSFQYYSSPLTLNINGSNSFVSTYNRSYTSQALDTSQSLTITGSGSLTVVGGNSTSGRSYGIIANGDVIISGTVAVTAISGTANNRSYGIQANGDVTINGTAKVIATGGTAGGNSYGIFLNNGEINFSGGDLTVSGKTSAANTGSITPAIAAVDASNADGRAAVRRDNTEIDLTAVKYIKTYKTEADYHRDYPPVIAAPEPEPQPAPSYPSTFTPPVYTPAPTYEVGYSNSYISKSGVKATVTLTEDGVFVTAGLNKSGSVNSEATAAAVKKAAEIAKANGDKSITVIIPDGATGLSKSTVQKLVSAADGLEIVLVLTSMEDGEEVGSISFPINSKTGQILTGLYFETKNINSAQKYISKNWKTDILGTFETAQKGGWGDTATLSVSMDKLGFSADDGTLLYALIYDTKAKKWYQVSAVIYDGEVVIETKRTGIVSVVTDSVK